MRQMTTKAPITPVVDRRASAAVQASDQANLPLSQFVWGAGIECSFLPHLNVDQFQWTQHDRFWKEDFRLAREQLGISHLRYAFPWHVLEPQPGRFDFAFADQRMEEIERLGLKLVLDVMHFGAPLWIKQAVGDPEFPEALERFTTALVERYADRVAVFCPLNEPLVMALFSGDFGFWPPHSRKWRGYMPVLSRVTQAVARSIRAIRRARPDAVVMLCDAVENYKTRVDSLQVEIRRRNLRRFLVLDLLTARVDAHHPLYPWLTAYGFSELDLEWFRANPQPPDLLGLDYYSHSDWQLDIVNGSIRQRRADTPVGLYGIGTAYYQRYGIPMVVAETSIEGQAINREIWFDTTVEDARRLRSEGVPLLGYFWWPLIDQVDWDGALTHRIGKVHEVGLYTLRRQADGTLARIATPMVERFRQGAAAGEALVGPLDEVAMPGDEQADQGPPIGVVATPEAAPALLTELPAMRKNGNGHRTGGATLASLQADAAPGLSAEPMAVRAAADAARGVIADESVQAKSATGEYGIVVFSHLRWGFVWQRPQQFLSRFARRHRVLFIEEPFFDLKENQDPHLSYHRVMPNVVVATPHISSSWNRNPKLPAKLLDLAKEAIHEVNESGDFDRPVLWYYSPMDSAWSLGHLEHRGIVYDCMDELSQFTGAPAKLVANETRLMQHADIVFTGGYALGEKKRQQHANVHVFGCGVEVDHFGKAMRDDTTVPPDIDFMARPILGWFGVVDERVDYSLVHELAKLRPGWSIAMVGPVVKMDPNLLPHAPNLFWLGQRDYQVLPNYCKAFSVCIMPFAMNASTQYINPTKGLEYLATGRPVISTPVRDVVRQWSDLIYIEKTPEDWARRIERILAQPDQQRIGRGIDLARGNSWENTVRQMEDLIRHAISRPDNAPSRHIEPLQEAELVYTYEATQGS